MAPGRGRQTDARERSNRYEMCRAKYGSDPAVTLTIIKIGGQKIDATQP